jgi:hypothetical protein
MLDLAADQVIGATGVPIEGDPGWERAKADPNLSIDYQRNWYAARRTYARLLKAVNASGFTPTPSITSPSR